MSAEPPSLKELFLAVLAVPPAERPVWLEEKCGQDAELRRRVELMLAAHDTPQSLLDRPAPAAVPPEAATADFPGSESEQAGAVIGPYKLLQQIGEGGMGTVFMAEQTQPVRRKVALKVIKAGMDTRQVIARFEAERQALAMMDHVNIARVLDVGATDSGRPFFVMELVHGVPITKYCDDNHLTPRERLELFVPVCQAIQHAHQKGIIHRDIKPSNILVTLYDGKPVPKVIDFGVAKATEQPLTERTLFTQYGTMVGTLEYMSPEQAEMSALGVDTRGDIYSLGVLLYELLTGSTPLSHKRLKEAAYAEILRMIREEEPPKPSTRLSDSGAALASISALRHMEPAKLAKLMRGELDWIVMRTLEKDRNRRYETANGLAMDVQRYLNDEEVQACPPSAGYKLRKFARRNKAALATAAIIGAALILGTLVSTSMAFRATRAEQLASVRLKSEIEARSAADAAEKQQAAQRAEAESQRQRAEVNMRLALRALDEIYINLVEKSSQDKSRLTPADEELLKKGLAFYQGFASQNSNDRSVQAQTAKAYHRVGSIRFALAQFVESEKAFRKTIALFEELVAEFPDEVAHRISLAESNSRLQALLVDHLGQVKDAEKPCRRALELYQRLAAEMPGQYRHQLALGHEDLGRLLSRNGRYPEAEETLRQAIPIRQKLVNDSPTIESRQALAVAYSALAEPLRGMGQLREAVQAYHNAIQVMGKLLQDFPGGHRIILAIVYKELGHTLIAIGDSSEAEKAYLQAITVSGQLTREQPNTPEYRFQLASSYLGLAAAKTGRLHEAQEACRKAVELYEKLVAEYPTAPEYREWSANGYLTLVTLFSKVGRRSEAEVACRKALDLFEKLAIDFPAYHPHRGGVSNALYWLFLLLAATERTDEAGAVYQRLVELSPTDGSLINNLAWFLATCPDPNLRNAAKAVELGKKAVQLAPKEGNHWNTLGAAHYCGGNWKDSIAALEKSMELRQGGDSFDFFFLAMAHWQLGDKDQARKWYEQGGQWTETNKPQDEELRRFRAEAAGLLQLAEPPKDGNVPTKEQKQSPSKK